MAFLKLPNEIVVAIAINLDSLKQTNAFARTNQHCYAALNRYLYLSDFSRTGTRSLHWAAEKGLIGTIEKFIEVGAIDGPDAGRSIDKLLNIAAFRGHVDIVTLLIKHGERIYDDMSLYCQNALDIEGIFTDGQKAIHLAARCDKKQIIKLLFHKGVDLYSLDEDKTSALQIAATEANLKALDALLKSRRNYKKTVTKCLLEYGADPYLKDRDGSTPLLIASSLGLVREIETLLEHGVHPDGLDRDGHSDRAVSPDELEQMEKENPAELSRGNVETQLIQLNGTTPLCMAARVGSYDAAHLLLKQGTNPNVKNQNGDTPLHLAVLRSEGGLVSLLIRKGASIDAQNSAGQSPLGVALKTGDIDLIETIFDKGPRIECIDSTGVHPIFRALEYGHGRDRMSSMLLPPHIVDTGKGPSSDYQNRWEYWCSSCYSDEEEECERVIEWFLERGTDVNTCTKSVKLLLGKGANPMAKDSFGQIPLHMACGDKLPDTEKVFEMLLEAGCDPNCKDENGDTPLHIAARSCYKTAISILRGGGRADLLATNNRGNTPMHEAMDVYGVADGERSLNYEELGPI